MPRLRPDLEAIPTYDPGSPLEEVARRLGLDHIADLASNELPVEPLPAVVAAIAAAAPSVNRYPDSDARRLVQALANLHAVAPESFWVAPGSTALLISIALTAAGPGSSVVFADPSFLVYRMATVISGATPLPIPLDADWRHDTDAMIAAVREDTSLIFYCNPNNPTGTHTPLVDMQRLIDSVPDRVTIVIDEAYGDYVTAPDWSSAVPLALSHDNVVVSRTFSKVYGLAGERVGYAIGSPPLLAALRRVQPPYSVSTLAQVAALEALRHQDLIAQRVRAAVIGREQIAGRLRQLGQLAIDSQTNFVLWRPTHSTTVAEALLRSGTLVRQVGPWLRITVGTPEENDRCLAAIEVAIGAGLA